MLPLWSAVEQALETVVFAAFAEPVTLNEQPLMAIIAREMVEVGEYAAVSHELRWKIHAQKTDVAAFARHDRVAVAGKLFRVDVPDMDDGLEVSAWLREVGNV